MEGYNQGSQNKIDILSNLPDSNNLGYMPSNILNDRKNLKPSNEITAWLQSFVNKQFGSNPGAKAKKILWVIQDLSVGKDSTQKEAHSFVKVKADIYTGNEESITNYELTNTYDSTWITTNNNADFGKMIAKALIELYNNSIEQRKSDSK